MNPTKSQLLAAGLLAALALPASASAHPGVFTVQASVVGPGAPTPPTSADLVPQTQYSILNDGRVIALRESNSAPSSAGGVINYKKLPGTFRANTAEFPTKAAWLTYAPADTDVQLHATCVGPAALSSSATILAWQNDPFYNYIPWQSTSAGLGDDPAKWLPVVKSATGVDLTGVTDVAALTSACTGLGGTFYPADAVVTTPTSASSASIADAVTPVQTKADGLQAQLTASQTELVDVKSQLTALTGAKTDADAKAAAGAAASAAALAAAQSEAAAAKAEVAKLKLELAPLTLTAGDKRTPATFASTGQPVKVTAAPQASVTVTVKVSAGTAKALALKSTTLGTGTATVSAAGSGEVTVKASPKAATALKKTKSSVKVTLTATSGQRSATTTATLTR